jgi:hypothetical protein
MMLWDPKNDFHTLYGLRDWLAKQPADQEYTWSHCQDCVVGKYLKAHGESPELYAEWIERTPGAGLAIHECFADFSRFGGRQRMTMGDALKNLDAYMAKTTLEANHVA